MNKPDILYGELTILDQFALQAMKGLIEIHGANQPYVVAEQAYNYAQAMMNMREMMLENA